MKSKIWLVVFSALLLAPAGFAGADEAEDLYNLGVGMYKQKRWPLAAESFQSFLAKYPQHARAPLGRLYLGLSLVNLRQYDDARKQLREFVQQNPQSRYLPDALYRVAECSYLLDDLKSADAEFQRFLQQNPQHELAEWALPYWGDAQLRLSKPEAAAATFREALKRFPEGRMAEDARFGLARALETLKQPDEALKLYQELAAHPQSSRAPQAQLKLGALHFDAKRYADAADAYLTVPRKFPESSLVPLAQLNAGYALYQLNQPRQAIEQFTAAARTREQLIPATYWKGVSHKALGEYEQAVADLKTAFEAGPAGPLAEQILHQWADTEFRRGEFAAAGQLFLKLVDTWPRSDLADDALHLAGEAALSAGDVKAAEQLLARFQRDYPQSALKFHQQLLSGRLLEAQGGDENLRRAVGEFESVLQHSTLPRTQAQARFHLARVRHKLHEDRKALETIAPLTAEVRRKPAPDEFVDALILEGVAALAVGEHPLAIDAMTAYLRLRPAGQQADQALATLSVACAQLGRKTEAETHLGALRRQFPQSPLRGAALHQAAEIAYGRDDFAWSAALFESLAELEPDSPYRAKGLSGLAWSLHAQKKFDEAARLFARVASDFADEAELASEAAYMHGQSLQDGERPAEAAAAFAAAFRKHAGDKPHPPGAEQHGVAYYAYRAGLQAARLLRTLGKVPEADAAYEELLQRFPQPQNLDKLLDEWALLNYEAGNYARSDEIFRRLVRELPDSDLADNARLSLAESDLLAGKLEEVRGVFAALEADPKSDLQVKQTALSHLIGIAVEQQRWHDVRELSQRMIETYPEGQLRWQARFYQAEALVQLDDAAAAQKVLLELKRDLTSADARPAEWSPRVWVLLAETYLREKKYDDVRRTVAELEQRDSQTAFLYQAYEVLGRTYVREARLEEARAALGKALAQPAARRTETAAKCQFLIAETYLMQKDLETALKEYLKVYHLYAYPQWQAPALFQAALCDEGLGQWKDAVQAYEDLLKDFPQSEYAEKAKARLPVARQKAGP